MSRSMYVGRLLLLGRSVRGHIAAAYRLASRSFSKRRIALTGNLATVRPMPAFEHEAVLKNLTPYYCLGLLENVGILVANGRHFPPIFSKISSGTLPKRAISEVLGVFGPEEDEFLTPRICGFISESELIVGIVSKEGASVREYNPVDGRATFLSTYVLTDPDQNTILDFDFSSIYELAKNVHEGPRFRKFSHRICTVAGAVLNGRFGMTVWS